MFVIKGHAARTRQGTFVSGAQSLPVMVWLHGGAFQQGGARRMEYDGRRLAEREMVVVTLNYRLGALGFLVSSRDGLYGNFGLMVGLVTMMILVVSHCSFKTLFRCIYIITCPTTCLYLTYYLYSHVMICHISYKT